MEYHQLHTELEDVCRCEICGFEGRLLTGHLRGAHAITPEEYRREFPGAPIESEVGRANRICAKTLVFPHWERLWTLEYALDRLHELWRLGHPVHYAWLASHERVLANYLWGHMQSWDHCLESIDLDPKEIRRIQPGEHLTKEDVVLQLQERAQAGRPLNEAAIRDQDLRLYNACRRRFGSVPRALSASGD